MKLKPCPFCGTKNEGYVHLLHCYEKNRDCIQCRGCGSASGWQDSAEEATKAWNTRHYDQIVQALREERRQLTFEILKKDFESER